jgi:hypothetical protein
MKPKILVSMPTADSKDYCVDDFIKQIKTLTYSNYDIMVLDNSEDPNHVKKFWDSGIVARHEPFRADFRSAQGREELARHQNIIRDYAIGNNYDYLFMLESDVFCGESIIEQLLIHAEEEGAGIVTATYEIMKEEGPTLCLTATSDLNGVRTELILPRAQGYSIMGQGCKPFSDIIKESGLRLTATGIGCTLIHKEVLKEVPFRVNTNLSKTAYSDTYYFTDAAKKGFEIMLHSDIVCEHRK